MLISVIVCTYNRSAYLYRCLSLLAQNDYHGSWELMVINNNSTDDTAQVCERFATAYPNVNYHYHLETEQGLSHARNRGLREAHGDWYVFLDDDAYVAHDYLTNLEKHLHNADFDAFGGKITPLFEPHAPLWYSRWSMGFVSALDMGNEKRYFPHGKFPIGANMGLSRNAVKRVGMFNTTLGRNKNNLLAGEEKDIIYRIVDNGMTVAYLPDIEVQHVIPEHRTTDQFIARLGYGVGQSERLRTQANGAVAYCIRLCSEAVKWGATITIAAYYTITAQYHKGRILLLFRKNVTQGLLAK